MCERERDRDRDRDRDRVCVYIKPPCYMCAGTQGDSASGSNLIAPEIKKKKRIKIHKIK